MQQLGTRPTDLERYICLIVLLDANETLFYEVQRQRTRRKR
jgi:hypothetical protein